MINFFFKKKKSICSFSSCKVFFYPWMVTTQESTDLNPKCLDFWNVKTKFASKTLTYITIQKHSSLVTREMRISNFCCGSYPCQQLIDNATSYPSYLKPWWSQILHPISPWHIYIYICVMTSKKKKVVVSWLVREQRIVNFLLWKLSFTSALLAT